MTYNRKEEFIEGETYENKRLIWTLVFLAILTLGSIGTDLSKRTPRCQ